MSPLFLLFACAPAKITIGDGTLAAVGPVLAADPAVLSFGTVSAGMGGTAQVLTLTNAGDETLDILGFSIDDPTAPFSMLNVDQTSLEAGATSNVIVSFSPTEPGSYGANLQIASTDPAGITEVVLVGESADGGLALDPAAYDFGTVTADCPQTLAVTVSNVGGSVITVTGAGLSGGEGEMSVSAMGLPWALAAGQSSTLTVSFAPNLEHVVFSTLTVTSDSGLTPAVSGTFFGTGEFSPEITDSFSTGDGKLDLVLFADKSQSMHDAQYVNSLRSNLDTVYDTLVAENLDFQLAVLTDDDGCVNGRSAFITEETERTQALSTLSIMYDTTYYGGELAEQGFSVLYAAALASGDNDCNPGLVRADGGLLLIGVSDEDEQSDGDAGTWVSQLAALKDEPGRVQVNAISGDLPSGCDDAEAGTNWSSVAQLTSGSLYSICDSSSDWDDNFAEMIRSSAGLQRSYALSGTPEPGTIVVEVDGEISYDWTYDGTANAVAFTDGAPLTWNQDIRIQFTVNQTCDG